MTRSILKRLELSLLAPFLGLFAGCESPDHVPAYHAPLASVGARYGALPAAVQNTIRAESGSAEVRDIDKEIRTIGPVYKITYANDDMFPPLFVAGDGSVVNPDMTVAVGAVQDETAVIKGGAAGSLSFSDLPGPVAKVAEQNASRSEIHSIDKESWGSRVVYIISFKNETLHPRLYISTDGTVLHDVRH